jgi:hypothetical protein
MLKDKVCNILHVLLQLSDMMDMLKDKKVDFAALWCAGSFVVLLSMIAFLHRMPATAGTSCDGCDVQESNKRNTM